LIPIPYVLFFFENLGTWENRVAEG
jgi:hypothetical protein